VHLAYLDESGSHDKKDVRFQVMAGVIIEGWEFISIEVAMGLAIEELLPEDKRESFEEFHAYELFNGCGIFEGIDQEKRLGVVSGLLDVVSAHKVPIVYGAVDVQKLASTPFRSAQPVDVCFNICVCAIEYWAGSRLKLPADTESEEMQNAQPLVVLIADDFPSKSAIKEEMKKSFRTLRAKVRPPHYDAGKSWHLHDSLYFGSSKDSIGIQLADLCAFIIRRNLEGDPSVKGHYDIIAKNIFNSRIEPQ